MNWYKKKLYNKHTIKNMKLEVSIGEAIDKYSILEIKLKEITEEYKLCEIQDEINQLQECKPMIEKESFFYNILLYFNTKIWNLTDAIKLLDVTDEKYPIVAQQIFDFNQKRFRVKNLINQLSCSKIVEHKSYSSTHCDLFMDNEEVFYDKITEISYLLFEYDYLLVDIKYLELFHKIFKNRSGSILDKEKIPNQSSKKTVCLENFTIDPSIEPIFALKPITYVVTGKLGDFIQSISIINEKFYSTGRKGVLYVRGDENFTNGLVNTYKDTMDVISSQRYITYYKLYNNEVFDIDLSIWYLNRDFLYKTNWVEIFKNTYNENWGQHKWLQIPYEKKWEDKVLINEMHYRKAMNIDYSELHRVYGSSLVFISFQKIEYEVFVRDTGLNIEHYMPYSFTDACIAINSCKLLVAAMSGILTIGHACHKKRIIGFGAGGILQGDNIHNMDFNKYWDNVYYDVSQIH